MLSSPPACLEAFRRRCRLPACTPSRPPPPAALAAATCCFSSPYLLPAVNAYRGLRRRLPRLPLSGSADLGLASTPCLRLRLARVAAGEAPVEAPPSKPVA
ncbi:hypothetical protein E2562_025356 [Oryza meyeriana var. granulata]|uniref:Uncharacterized protein n=1 Tax=Oryza meyeriana var. granulata TaxID=110450 RepID=A0A6G1DNH7_9ORYZ|nr:hypothetical protein E2562_025356 [Oryza meyeriana var. granulata]